MWRFSVPCFPWRGLCFFEDPGLSGGAAALGGAAFVASDTILAVNLIGEKNSRKLDKILLVCITARFTCWLCADIYRDEKKEEGCVQLSSFFQL